MSTAEIRKVVIAGGGTAGWIAAAALSHQFHGIVDITLIESDEIGTIGVGESTIPPIRSFHQLMGIDEQEFMRATAATFKLGISFEHWGRSNDHYFHPFGSTGKSTWACEFHHFWMHSLSRGMKSDLGDFCLEHVAARAGKFMKTPDVNYAYHLDAAVYARFLRRFSEKFGARRVEGKIREVRQNSQSGLIEALLLESGQVIEGDLFIDCTGFRGLLIEQTLHTGYEDWSQWLPCDSAVAVQTESTGPAVPYTRAIAHEAGWRWRIPLQHRVGNGLVYCSRHLSDTAATEALMKAVDGKALVQPRVIKFRTGRRLKAWNRNVVTLGLASGFVEPLESTSIHLIITGITRLIHLFPFAGTTQALTDKYNEDARAEFEKVRDFIVLHYKATERDDTDFWRECRDMPVPDSLQQRLDAFRERGHAWQAPNELFRVDSWIHVMFGQRLWPQHYHQLTTAMRDADLSRFLDGIRTGIAGAVERMPAHHEFIAQYAPAQKDIWESLKTAMGS